MTQEQAAEKLNVSSRSVRRARDVIEHAPPPLVDAVVSGHLTVNLAELAIGLPPAEGHS